MKKREKRDDITRRLVLEGWQTPHTYSNHFAPIPDAAGVYALVVFPDFLEFKAPPVIGYVGKSRHLCRRLAGHPVVRLITKEDPDCIVQQWFLELAADRITTAEVDLIRRFNPPYNLQHRCRGLHVAEQRVAA